MINDAAVAKMNTLIQEPNFLEELKNLTSTEELLALLDRNGIEMTQAEYDIAVEKGTAMIRENNLFGEDGELSAEMLDLVNGGGWGSALICWGLAAVCIYFGFRGAAVLMIFVGLACLKS